MVHLLHYDCIRYSNSHESHNLLVNIKTLRRLKAVKYIFSYFYMAPLSYLLAISRINKS